jgi:hypothetical protein
MLTMWEIDRKCEKAEEKIGRAARELTKSLALLRRK